MIIDKEVEIKINAGNYRHFKSLNYEFNGVGDSIIIDVNHLMRGSAFVINVRCSICLFEQTAIYKNYIKNSELLNFYCCKKCTTKNKTNILNLEKYGVEYVSQYEPFNEIKKRNCAEKYGSENYLNSDDFKKKMIDKFGVINPLKSKELLNKANETTFKNFGVLYPKQSEVVRSTERKNNIEKYGVEHYSSTDEYKEKYMNTCIEKYGVDNASKYSIFINKIKTTKIERGIQVENIEDFLYYSRIVRTITKKNKKSLLDKWDGNDYYDNEYILENFKLKHTNRKYPTIDHKISVFYGFKNGILPFIIADIDNLCITKRCINSSKNKKTEYEFKAT